MLIYRRKICLVWLKMLTYFDFKLACFTFYLFRYYTTCGPTLLKLGVEDSVDLINKFHLVFHLQLHIRLLGLQTANNEL